MFESNIFSMLNNIITKMLGQLLHNYDNITSSVIIALINCFWTCYLLKWIQSIIIDHYTIFTSLHLDRKINHLINEINIINPRSKDVIIYW